MLTVLACSLVLLVAVVGAEGSRVRVGQLKAAPRQVALATHAPSAPLVVESVETAAAPAQSAPAPLVTLPALGSTLYDNGPFINAPGSGPGGTDLSILQNTSLGMTINGFGNNGAAGLRLSDNFTVTDPGGWQVDEFVFYNYQTGSTTTSTMTGVTLRLWDGPPNAGGTVIFGDTTTNRLVSSIWTNVYRVAQTTRTDTTRPVMRNTVTAGLTLTPGSYWVDWGTTGSLASGPWSPPITISGTARTGDALQFNGGVWRVLTDTVTGVPGGLPQGLPFQALGTVLSGGNPSIAMTQTVGTSSGACATTDAITVTMGTTVYYCYTIANTGNVTLTRHDLVDSELGTILAAFPFTLTPTASAFITASTPITMTTVSTSTWTAYNPGPTDVVSDTDSATVNVTAPTAVGMAELSATTSAGTPPLVGWLVAGVVTAGAGATLAYRRRRRA